MMAQDTVIASVENNGDYITGDIKMFILQDPIIYSQEIIQQKNKALSMMMFCAGQYYYLKSVNI